MPALTPHSAETALTYELIEAAVQETGRGRWFLAEYARRNRNADTLLLLEELKKINAQLTHRPQLQSTSSPTTHEAILDIGRAIARTERDIRAISVDKRHAGSFLSASDALDDVVETTQKATSGILSAAERIQEYAWTMREQNGADSGYDILDTCVSEIYVACGFQDLTAQRISKVMTTLRFIDDRVSDMLKQSGLDETLKQELLNEDHLSVDSNHQRQGSAADDIWMSEAHQAEIDETFEFFTPAEIRHEPTMIDAELFDRSEQEAMISDAPLPLTDQEEHRDVNHADPQSTSAPMTDSDALSPDYDGDESHATLMKRAEEMREHLEQKHDSDTASAAETPPISKKNAVDTAQSPKEAFDTYEGLSTEERLRSFR